MELQDNKRPIVYVDELLECFTGLILLYGFLNAVLQGLAFLYLPREPFVWWSEYLTGLLSGGIMAGCLGYIIPELRWPSLSGLTLGQGLISLAIGWLYSAVASTASYFLVVMLLFLLQATAIALLVALCLKPIGKEIRLGWSFRLAASLVGITLLAMLLALAISGVVGSALHIVKKDLLLICIAEFLLSTAVMATVLWHINKVTAFWYFYEEEEESE